MLDGKKTAQFATYMGEVINDPAGYDFVNADFSSLASRAMAGEDIVRPATEYDQGSLIGEPVTMLDHENYRSFVESLDEVDQRVVDYIAQKLDTYETIKPQVQAFLDRIKERGQEHPSHIAQNVYLLTSSDGKEFVVRKRKSIYIYPYLVGASLITGVPHFEQIIAASFEDGVTIAERIPGKQLNELSVVEREQITDDQFDQGVDSLLIAYQRGLPMENKPKNIMYDPQAGFGFIDFVSGLSENKQNKGEDISSDISLWIYAFLPESSPFNLKSLIDIESAKSILNKRLAILRRIEKIVINKQAQTEIDLTSVANFISSEIEESLNNLRDYGDDQWVSTTIARNNKQSKLGWFTI
jgi:hypothetical protein